MTTDFGKQVAVTAPKLRTTLILGMFHPLLYIRKNQAMKADVLSK